MNKNLCLELQRRQVWNSNYCDFCKVKAETCAIKQEIDRQEEEFRFDEGREASKEREDQENENQN